MAVVIDDFEVVANEGEGSKSVAPPATNNAASSPTAHDIEQVVQRECERYERVWAH